MNARRDPDRLIHDFLMEGQTGLADQVYDAVRATIEHERQRVVIGPWRMPTMNKFVPIGLLAAAVVVALVIGTRLLPAAPSGVGGAPSVEPSATPATTPSAATWVGIPEGAFVVTGSNDPVQVTVDVASPRWSASGDFNSVEKGDDGLDAPETVGAVLLAWAWPAGTGFNVYGDPCQSLTTIPETPATTPDEIATAFAAQASPDAAVPVDVTVGGFAGKSVTLRVPMSFDLPNATRGEKFADCDRGVFSLYGIEGDTGEVADAEFRQSGRNAQGAGQVDELWILDVDGSRLVIDGFSMPQATDPERQALVDVVESIRFQRP